MKNKNQLYKALKIAIACSLSVFIAELLQISYAASAGTVALLTVTDSRKDTLILAVKRLISFLLSMVVAYLLCMLLSSDWLRFTIYVFFTCLNAYYLDWGATISVNSVVGSHLLFQETLTFGFIINELWIVFIGSVVAIIINMFILRYDYEKDLKVNIHDIEDSIQNILLDIASYLLEEKEELVLNKKIHTLESYTNKALNKAITYKNDVLEEHSEYYINYMTMRLEQVHILDNMMSELHHLRTIPKETKNLANFIVYITPYTKEYSYPKKFRESYEVIKEELFKNKEEPQSIAILYALVLDLEEFLSLKKNFIDSINEEQKKLYWK